METIIKIMLLVSSLFYLISMMLNSLGVYLLSATRPLNSSKILLINLAVSEIFAALVESVSIIGGAFLPLKVALKIGTVLIAIFIPYYFAMCILTIDRLIAVVFPLKHRVMVTNRRLIFTIVVSWFLALLIAISLPIFWETFHLDYRLLNLTWVFFDTAFIILFFITYSLIFIKILQRRRLVNNQQDVNAANRRQNERGKSRFFKITALIILSFVLFILVPNIVSQFTRDETVIASLRIAWSLGMTSDPLIYIFLQDNLRLLLKTKLCTCKKEVRQELDNTVQDTAL